MTEVEQKQNHRMLCNKYTHDNWRNLPKSIKRLWSYLAINQSYPSILSKWTVEQIDQLVEKLNYPNFLNIFGNILLSVFFFRYKFLLPDFNNNELSLIPFDELSKMALHDIEFEKSQVRN